MSAEAIARLRKAITPARPFGRLWHVWVIEDDLRALLDAHEAEHARGVADERARVVAWLRNEYVEGCAAHVEACSLADAIERGEHEEAT